MNISSTVCKVYHVKVFLGLLSVFLLGAVNLPADPASTNDICINAVPLVDNVYTSENTADATDDAVPTLGTISKGVWFSYTPPVSGLATVDTCPSDFDTMVEVVGECGTSVSLGANDDGDSGCSNYGASSVSFYVLTNRTYYICAGGYGGVSGNLQIRVQTAPVPVLGNGGSANSGLLAENQSQAWIFTGNAGDRVVVRGSGQGDAFALYVDDLGSFFAPGLTRCTMANGTLTHSGIHVVSVQNYFEKNSLGVTLAKIPADPPGSLGTVLKNGASVFLPIFIGGQAVTQFSANAGDSLQLRIEAWGIILANDIFGPDGSPLSTTVTQNDDGALYFAKLTNSGIYTIVVGDVPGDRGANPGNAYVNLAKVPGPLNISTNHSGGALTNGVSNSGALSYGDQNMWSFSANAGDNLQLHVPSVGFTPRIDLYGPNGELAGRYAVNTTNFNVSLSCQLTNSGTYVAVISSYFFKGLGTYQLTASGITAPPGVKLSATIVSGTNLSLSASGGGTNQTFVILSSTNLALPMDLWTPFLTNQFDEAGNAATSNLLDLTQPAQYFRLSVP